MHWICFPGWTTAGGRLRSGQSSEWARRAETRDPRNFGQAKNQVLERRIATKILSREKS